MAKGDGEGKVYGILSLILPLYPHCGETLLHLTASTSKKGGGKSRFYEMAKGDGMTGGQLADAGRGGGAQVLEGR